MSPKVFVSHATEDKNRFVEEFARKLRSNGVDAWLDKWEMRPGDSLVEKIFDEGLKNAQAIIIVLSTFSVQKPWVREELNASLVARISKGVKIIPILIDDCTVPIALKSTLWIQIKDLSGYDDEFSQILAGIFDVHQKPPIGLPPVFAQEAMSKISGLSISDTAVLKRICEEAISKENKHFEIDQIFPDPGVMGLSRQQISDSLDILESDGYLKLNRLMGGMPNSYNCLAVLTEYGFQAYSERYYQAYRVLQQKCALLIVNENMSHNSQLRGATNAPKVAIDFVLDSFESNGWVKCLRSLGGETVVRANVALIRRAIERGDI